MSAKFKGDALVGTLEARTGVDAGRFSKKTKETRAVTAWLLVFALMVQALVPLGKALAAELDPNITYLTICTGQGIQTIALDENGQPTKDQGSVACPFCVLQIAPAIVDAPQAGVPLVFAHGVLKASYGPVTADRHANLWCARPRMPRGPPLGV